MFEKILGHLAGEEQGSRVALVQVGEEGQTPTLELRLQRQGGDLGWITQKRIRLAAGQIPDMRDALNMMDCDARGERISAQRKGEVRGLRVVGTAGERQLG